MAQSVRMKSLLTCTAICIAILLNNVSVQAEPNTEVIPASEVNWEKLNPARGDKSPQAATLWGDRKANVATGFLVKFVDGFSSPPHIHNVTYRGVVISGRIHNDDPKAANMWMPTGSFWTQPKGEVHITSAKGSENVAYIEIEEGPYLVMPSKKAFDSGQRSVNVDPSNLVWLKASDLAHMRRTMGPEITLLWGSTEDGQMNGTLVRLPDGFRGKLNGNGSLLQAVIIDGQLHHSSNRYSDHSELNPGSYFSTHGTAASRVSAKGDCLIYVRTRGKFKLRN